MPTRMVRESLLSSDRFLALPDNTSRMCYIACLLTADDRGNREAGLGSLVRLWRDFGIDGTEKAASIGQFLADQDLIRFYEKDEKQYLHVPRFNQRVRYIKRSCPQSPWCKTSEETSKSSQIHPPLAGESQPKADYGRPEVEVEVEVKDLSGKPDLPGFTLFWKTWPKGERKQGKSKCLAIWKRKALEGKADLIVAHVEKLKQSESWRRGYDPMPTTYLNEERWDGADMGEPALRVAL